MEKRTLLSVIALISIAILASAMTVSAETSVTMGKNGEAAKALYKISDENVYEVADDANAEEINEQLRIAGSKAGETISAMVYVPAGNHDVNQIIRIPKGVVLVSEKESMYSGNPRHKDMISIKGSLYGGTFDGKNVQCICWLDYVKFSGNNGEIRNANLKNAKEDGIHYGSSANKKKLGGAKAIGNNISDCKINGITVVNGGSFRLISNNRINKVGAGSGSGAAISVTHANVTEISKNVISNTTGHGISTDTDFTGMVQKTVTIGTIANNKISKTNKHGIYVDDRVTVKKINGNTIKGSKKCGIAIAEKKNGKIIGNGKINSFNNNTITGSKDSNVTMVGKGSYLKVGSGNTIKNSKSIGIMVRGKSKLIINGKNNVITGNKNDVRVLKSEGAKFTYKNKKNNNIKNIRIV